MRPSISALLALSISASAAPSGWKANGTAPLVTVKNGTLAGVHSQQYNQDFFLGIPYAQPPVGDLRFRQARSLNESWEGTKSVTSYQASCVGYGSDQWGYEISEDCLYLNVIRPSGYENAQLPVAFWIHGGGFSEGGAGDKRYNLSFIVENSVKIGKPIVAVSTNYRLSAWGFLNSDEVMGEGNTNMGLKDQRLALRWVQENIAAFGGDPTKVAIWGESAGAASVGFHLTAYGGRDDKLFRAAIMESGGPILYGAEAGTQTSQPVFDNVTAQANCSSAWDKLQCLRQVPFSTLNTIFNSSLQFGPGLDGDFVRNYGSVQLSEGAFVHVPIIIGANSDEGASFSPRGINTTEDFKATLSTLPATFQDKILEAYPDDLSVNVIASLGNNRPPAYPFGLQFRRSASYYGDVAFIAPRRATCEAWAANNLSAYCYRFNAVPAGIPYYSGVPHFQEVAFVFDNILGEGYGIYPSVSTKPFLGKGKSYTDLAFLMSASWVSFVSDLEPNNWKGRQENVTAWPKYELEKPLEIVWDANVTSFAEEDTYRHEGIKLINDNAKGVYSR